MNSGYFTEHAEKMQLNRRIENTFVTEPKQLTSPITQRMNVRNLKGIMIVTASKKKINQVASSVWECFFIPLCILSTALSRGSKSIIQLWYLKPMFEGRVSFDALRGQSICLRNAGCLRNTSSFAAPAESWRLCVGRGRITTAFPWRLSTSAYKCVVCLLLYITLVRPSKNLGWRQPFICSSTVAVKRRSPLWCSYRYK